MIILFYLVRLHQVLLNDDYWSEDFDINKNCVREPEMRIMRRERDPGRCAYTSGRGWWKCEKILSKYFFVL